MHTLLRTRLFILAAVTALSGLEHAGAATGAPIAVTTYHYDTLRTGWNRNETALSAAAFPASFGVLQSVALDDQVDAQPLLVPGLQIAGGVHDVLYVVTENNSVYALDATSGAILVQRTSAPRCRRRSAVAITDRTSVSRVRRSSIARPASSF
jgi:hypothetical protein